MKEKYDFVVVAPLKEEVEAVLYALRGRSRLKYMEPFECYEVFIEEERRLKGLLLSQKALGQAHSAALSTYVFHSYDANVYLLTGICGGLQNNDRHKNKAIKIGDIVFADTIVAASIRKYAFNGFDLKSNVFRINQKYVEVFAVIKRIVNTKKYSAMRSDLKVWAKKRSAQLMSGSVVSIDSVIADAYLSKSVGFYVTGSNNVEHPLGLEMEGAGFVMAAKIFGQSDKVAMIRGVNDFADEDKNEVELSGRRVACENAALISIEFLKLFFNADRSVGGE